MIDFSKPMRVCGVPEAVIRKWESPVCCVTIGFQDYLVDDGGRCYRTADAVSFTLENIPEKPQPKVRYKAQYANGDSGPWKDHKATEFSNITAWLIETDMGDHLPDDERYEYRREVVK